MELCVVGAGYVGLVVAGCLADQGHTVRVIERDDTRRIALAAGVTPHYEPGLHELIQSARAADRIRFTGDVGSGATGAQVAFVAVGTPGGSVAPSVVDAVIDAVCAVGEHLAANAVVVLKSTVPVGTADRVAAALHPLRPDLAVVANPEFLAEGRAVLDFQRPPRVVIGGDDPAACALVASLYAPQLAAGAQLLTMDARSAELAKFGANLALAARISLINELAALAEAVGADILDVERVVGSDPRVGSAYLSAGAGFGGSCLPKDVASVASLGRAVQRATPMADAVLAVNAARVPAMLARLEGALGGLEGRVVAVWGLAYKPLTDDVRDAPALAFVTALLAGGAVVAVFDPEAERTARVHLHDRVRWAHDSLDAARGADAVVLLTEWPVFRTVPLEGVREVMRGSLLMDGRNIFAPEHAARAGLRYMGVGRYAQPPEESP